jgi:hypothetical protein
MENSPLGLRLRRKTSEEEEDAKKRFAIFLNSSILI